jgi:outer membrane receptor for ferrienterochelin and colicins
MKHTPFIYYKYLFLWACLFGTLSASAQNQIAGTVYELSEQQELLPVVGANVRWVNTNIGTITDLNGQFTLPRTNQTLPLVVSFVGYQNDTIPPEQVFEQLAITLKNNAQLNAVTVTAHQTGSFISSINPIKTEIISTGELRKAACCNLSESFETNATVEVSYSDAVSGAKEIRMLGLDGVYSQIMTESMPNLRGLANTFGLTYIPGSWIESIQITKGSGSVVNGYESITGQINVEYKKPQLCEKERLHINLYANHMGRMEANINAATMVGKSKKWSTILFGSGANFTQQPDQNHDGFADLPKLQNLTLKNRWHYQGSKFESQMGVQGLIEKRTGGQLSFDANLPRNTANGYGIGINTKRAEAFAKLGVFLPHEYQSIGNMVQVVYHAQDMFFGLKNYSGTQKSLYYSSIYQSAVGGNVGHPFKVGISYVFDKYHETYNDTLYQRTESVPGVFAEYTNKTRENLTLVAGVRADWHNLYGFFATPRLHLRYEPVEKTTIRAAVGSGFRTANVFAENVGIFASSRSLHITDALQPEKAWNYGINITQKFNLNKHEGSLSVDAYRTHFVNQVVIDMFSTNNNILVYNLNGKSFANSLQAELQYELFRRFDLKLAYKLDDARTTYQGQLLNLPFTSRHKALLNLGYQTPNEHWKFDFTTQWYGNKFLTNSLLADATPDGNRLLSPSYFVLLGQVSYVLPKWEFYIGGENLTNYRQQNLIVSAQNPFSNTFDATNVWGPTMGAVVYAGMRFTVK